MIDKFSQVAENLPAADRDADRQYHVINGYPVVFSFSKEPNPEAFERIRNILLATSYTKKVGDIMDECRTKRYTECGNGRYYKPSHCRTFFDNEIKPIPTFMMKVRNLQ